MMDADTPAICACGVCGASDRSSPNLALYRDCISERISAREAAWLPVSLIVMRGILEWLVQVHWAVDCLDVGLVCHASCVSVQFDHGGLNVDHFVSSFGQDGVVQDLRCDFQRCLMSSDEVVVDSSADVEEPCAVLELDGLDDSLSEGFQV